MRPGSCVPPGELADLTACPPGDPRLRHIEDCPRCRARLASYSKFMDPAAPEGSNPAQADSELAAILDREIYGPDAATRAPGRRSDRDAGSWLARLTRSLLRPALRPVWAVGIILLGFWGVQQVRDGRRGPGDRIILREGEGLEATRIELLDPVPRAGGEIVLRWSGIPEAEEYAVSIYGAQLSELDRFECGASIELTLPADRLRLLRDQSPALFWRVTAYRHEDPYAHSEIAILDRPSGSSP